MHVFLRNASPTPVPAAYRDGLVLDFFAERGRSTMVANPARLVERVGWPPEAAADFLLFGLAVYTADKKARRAATPDRWTRSFELSAPVADVDRWIAAEPALVEALAFLTGDRWTLRWRREENRLWRARRAGRARFDAACLFSGGLDSLIGAIDLLESADRPRVLLIGHYDSTLTPKVQRLLVANLAAHYGPERVDLVQIVARPAENRAAQQYPLPLGREPSTRSRSIAFLGLGMAAASALGSAAPLYVPENGFIALNVPLIPARLGSCSTRTTHSHFLEQIRLALGAVGVVNRIVNPYEATTKGEMVAQCRNRPLLERLAARTVSCAHPELGRYEGSGYGNCGYCFPCLIRRAALHAAGLDDAAQYKRDVCVDPNVIAGRTMRGRDARAVFAALYDRHRADGATNALRPLRSGPLAGKKAADLARLHSQGLDELRSLFDAKGSPEVRRVAGL